MKNTRALLVVSLLTAGMALAGRASAAEVELRNDSFETGQAAGFQGGFVSGEMGAARFVPPGACRVTKLKFLFGGSSGQKSVTFHVWEDPTGANDPGTEMIDSFDADLTGSNLAWQEVQLADPIVVVVNAPFRVGLEFHHDGYPSIARDNDGAAYPDRSFIYAKGMGWVRAKTLGVNGDWIIRAVADCGGPAPDSSPGPDTARPDAGLPPADATPAGREAGAGDGGGGKTCKSNPDCPQGQYCAADGICSYDCLKDSDCRSGHCNSLGKCVEGGGGCRLDSRPRPFAIVGPGLLLLALVAGGLLHRRVGRSRPRSSD